MLHKSLIKVSGIIAVAVIKNLFPTLPGLPTNINPENYALPLIKTDPVYPKVFNEMSDIFNGLIDTLLDESRTIV